MNATAAKLSLILISLSAVGLAESEAQTGYEKLKGLAGEWEGTLTTLPVTPGVQGKAAQVTIRVTSMGNAILHEMKIDGRQDDPITMVYLDSDHLTLTHYCDAGNRPRMVGKPAADGKTVGFDMVDIAGGTQYGHMHNASFSLVDQDHHVEEWTFMLPDSKTHVRAHF